MRNAEFGLRSAEGETERPGGNGGGDRVLVTRVGLAAVLSVSLHTVDRMLAAQEIPCIRLRGRVVRFYVPDVIECLKREQNKFGRRADTDFTNCHERGRTADRRG